MKSINFTKRFAASVAGITLAAGVFFSAGHVSAIPYTGDTTQPSPVPAFNVFTGVDQGVGNESDFLRSRVPVASPDIHTLYADSIAPTCDDGQNIQMRVYVHNGASQADNGTGNGASVAHGTKVKVTLPTGEAASFTPSATISATNAATVNDTTMINCNGKVVKLTYVAGSAKASSIGTGTVALSDDIVTSGVPISSEGVAGDVWGCWNERVYVLLTVKVTVTPPVIITPATCDLIESTTNGNTITVTKVNVTANSATVNNIVIDFGNGTTKTITSSDLPLVYTYPTSGDYNVTATVKTSLGDVTNAKNCVASIKKTSTPTPPPVTPPATPKTLPNTGAGSTIAIFGATSIIGAFLYRMRVLRGAK